jgi:DNA-binding NarL/FixJ family response regulator
MGERVPAERTTMRQVREVLRLRTAGVGLNEIARRVGVAPSTVRLTKTSGECRIELAVAG